MNSEKYEVQALLQAGGKGTRLDDVAEGIPKPMVRIAGVPMVERLMRQLVSVGVREIIVATGWKNENIKSHLLGLSDLPNDLNIKFAVENQPLGNVGAMANLHPAKIPTLLVFADLVTDIDFTKFMTAHRENGADITLASHYEKYPIQFGELIVDGNQVINYLEKPIKEYLICSGIAMFEPHVLELLNPTGPCGIFDLVNIALDKKLNVTRWNHNATWIDVNTREAFEKAQRHFETFAKPQ